MFSSHSTVQIFLVGGVVLVVITIGWLLVVFSPAKEVTIPVQPLYRNPAIAVEDRITDLLSYMSRAEKIGQMALVEKNSLLNQSDISEYGLGALLSGAGSKPDINTAAGWRAMISDYQQQAKMSRLGIPLLYGVDAVHGHGHLPGATVFPHAIGLGASNNPDLVKAIARATALELRATNINWSFSPTLDQPRDLRWGRTYETFSDDPAVVTRLGVAYLEGLQTQELADISTTSQSIAVLGTLKHYIGLGSMKWNSSLNENFKIDQGITPADETKLQSEYLPSFAASVEAGALSVMVGLNTWGKEKTVINKYLITDVLKDELGFTGFVVSDWYGVHEGRWNTFLATVQAVNAGVDVVMLPFDYKTFVRDMTWANRLGLISDARIDDAVRRILRAKFALGLFDEPAVAVPNDVIGSLEHRALARLAVAESAVLLKNDGAVLPIAVRGGRVRVAGSAANNIGRQSGAWTVEWQGIDGNELPGATSILAGIQAQVGMSTVVEYNALGDFASNRKMAEVGIAIVGEKPYAEGWGDTEYPILSDDDLQAIKNLQASSLKVVVVIVSGRPLLIANEIESWDALVAAWLPGSEGAGVADVLFGVTPFTGTLPLPWPRHTEQLPIAADGITSDATLPLFPRNYSLN